MLALAVSVMVLIAFADARGHGGRTDGNGGQTNRQTDQYPCHSGPCQSDHDTNAAERKPYDRNEFGRDWGYSSKNCLSLRYEYLLARSKIEATTDGCRVVAGQWRARYSGVIVYDASEIEIDFIVPLKEVWISGADRWSRERRLEFTKDTENLAVALRSNNRSKGSKDIANWRPEEGKCLYLWQWLAVKRKYELRLDQREREAIDRLRSEC